MRLARDYLCAVIPQVLSVAARRTMPITTRRFLPACTGGRGNRAGFGSWLWTERFGTAEAGIKLPGVPNAVVAFGQR